MVFYGDIKDQAHLFSDAMEAGGMAWWVIEYPSGLIFYDSNKIKMLGYSEKDSDKFIHLSEFGKLLHPDDSARAIQAIEDHIAGKTQEYQATYRIRTKSGNYKRFFDRGKVVGKSKKGECTIAGFAMDLSRTNLFPASS